MSVICFMKVLPCSVFLHYRFCHMHMNATTYLLRMQKTVVDPKNKTYIRAKDSFFIQARFNYPMTAACMQMYILKILKLRPGPYSK